VARLVVLATPALADGFRLAGAATIAVGPAETPEIFRRLAAEPDTGIVLVTDDLWPRIEDRDRRAVEQAGRPLVVAIPAGRRAAGPGRRAGHRRDAPAGDRLPHGPRGAGRT
jgi:vacuolar-type H+-ATPase subunit F/Vma7